MAASSGKATVNRDYPPKFRFEGFFVSRDDVKDDYARVRITVPMEGPLRGMPSLTFLPMDSETPLPHYAVGAVGQEEVMYQFRAYLAKLAEAFPLNDS